MAINTVTPTGAPQVKVQDNLKDAQSIIMQSIKNQNFRFKVIAENMTNAESTSTKPGGDPYQRKEVILTQKINPATGLNAVQVKGVVRDKSEFPKEHDPGHPAADAQGMVKKPNVNRVMESIDMVNVQNMQKALNSVYRETTNIRRLNIDLMR